jgi:hypothetical protein
MQEVAHAVRRTSNHPGHCRTLRQSLNCPHPQGTHDGPRGCGAPLVHGGADRGIPRLLCTMCQGTFSVRQGTASCGVRAEEPHYTIALRALAAGHALRGPGRIVAVAQDTVCDWLDRAGRHCPAVTTSLCDTAPPRN